MRSGLFRLAATSAFVVSGFVALASIAPAHAQTKPGAKPAAAQPAGAAAKVDKTACALEPKPNLSNNQKKTEAKKAFGEGKKRFDKGDYEVAYNCFKLADAYIPGAQPKYRAAASLDKLGKVVEAVAAYDIFLKDLGDKPDDKYKEMVDDAKKRTEELKKTPSKVTVAATPADAPNMKIMVDDAPQTGTELSLAPGKHVITIMADGYDPSKTEIEVGFAETKDIPVTLNKTPEPVATAEPTAEPTMTATAPPPPTTPPPPPPAKSYVPAYVTLGLAGVGAVVGGIFGGMALSSKGAFDETPTVELADETDRNALVADMAFAVALTFGVTGVVLLLSDPEPAKTTSGETSKQKKAASIFKRGFVAPYATPNGGGAAARFTF